MELSLIVPAFGRVELLRYTLESLLAAIEGLRAEILVVDDGSAVPLQGELPQPWLAGGRVRCLRQDNAGSTVARWHGLQAAVGEFVSFIDSDDLVAPEKYRQQLAALRSTGADIAYTDQESWETQTADPASCTRRTPRVLPDGLDSVELLLTVHPVPHNLVYRRRLFEAVGTPPWIPLHPLLRPVGDVWTYYLLAPFPAKAVKVPGPLTIFRDHAGERYSAKWEITGVGATALMHQFITRCPATPLATRAKAIVACNALMSLRFLPRGMPAPWEKVLESLWRSAPVRDLKSAGGRVFWTVARIIGLRRTVALFRWRQRSRYVADPQRVPLEQLQERVRGLAELTGA